MPSSSSSRRNVSSRLYACQAMEVDGDEVAHMGASLCCSTNLTLTAAQPASAAGQAPKSNTSSARTLL